MCQIYLCDTKDGLQAFADHLMRQLKRLPPEVSTQQVLTQVPKWVHKKTQSTRSMSYTIISWHTFVA